MGRYKIYTPQSLSRAVDKYFKTITREVVLTEKVATEKKDRYGHTIFEDVPVKNCLGEELKVVQYLVPPSVAGLSLFLKIDPSTWDNYCKREEFFDTTSYARGRMRAYLEQENLTRQGKDLKGVQFDLMNNHGMREKVDVSGIGVEEYLSRLQADSEKKQVF